MKLRVLFLLAVGVFALPRMARAQFLIVECSNPNATFQTISSALPLAGPGAFILVLGTCTENVTLYDVNNLTLLGGPANLVGFLNIINSQVISVYGFNVTNVSGDGIYVQGSHGILLDACSSNGNGGNGLRATQSSDVTINAFGTFNNNAGYGIFDDSNSFVNDFSFAGTTDISNNQTGGLWDAAVFSTIGNTHLANNGPISNPNPRVAIDMRGGGRAQLGAVFGPNVIENNANGGVSLQENAEISFYSIASISGPNVIRNNGPFGVEAGFGSQVTLAGAVISGHTGPGVDIYGHSQLYGTSQLPGLGGTQITGNATASSPLNAGIRVDGNSEVLLRGVVISENNGPGILALTNSSADFAGVTFTGNTGVISCDSSSTMVSDLGLPARTPAAGVRCTTAHSLGNRLLSAPTPAVPDMTAWKKIHADLQQHVAAQK